VVYDLNETDSEMLLDLNRLVELYVSLDPECVRRTFSGRAFTFVAHELSMNDHTRSKQYNNEFTPQINAFACLLLFTLAHDISPSSQLC